MKNATLWSGLKWINTAEIEITALGISMGNIVYIAASLDGFIADRDGGLDWLQSVPNPGNSDLGFTDFLGSIDCIVMGRNTFETVAAMDIDWPYPKPVFVLSHSLKFLPERLKGLAEIIRGTPDEITAKLDGLGYQRRYVDGGKTIQCFLESDRIDEMIISRLPILLGGGTPLFGGLPAHLMFEHIDTEVLLGEIVVSRYRRKRASFRTRYQVKDDRSGTLSSPSQ